MDHEVDAIGLLCPLPVLKAAKRLKSLAVGETLYLKADDPAAVVDVPHFCNEGGHELTSEEEFETYRVYGIKKGQRT